MSEPRAIETLQIGMTASREHMSGTDRYYQSLLRELPAHGIGVRGMLIGEPQAIDEPMPGVEPFATAATGRLARIRGARRVARRLLAGTSLVVSHGAPHTFYVLDTLGRRPLVAHFHGPWALEGREEGTGRAVEFVRHVQESAVYRRARRFIVLSRAFGDTLEREYGVDAARVRVIPGGVDLERFTTRDSVAQMRARLGWPAGVPIVLCARRLEPTKGVGALIDAVAAVRAQIPDVRLVITGTGSLAEPLRARVDGLGLRGNVTFLGHVASNDLPAMYRAADLSIVPSNAWEGFGLSVLESLACGTPALVTPVGGLPEAVAGLSPALVLAGTSAAEIAVGLLRILRDRSVAPGADACASYAKGFAWSEIARRVAAVYREIA